MEARTDEAVALTPPVLGEADRTAHIDGDLRRAWLYLEALDRRTLGALAPPLTVPQYHALVALARTPRQGVGELAVQLLCAKANASGIAERLVALGLVERASAADDARRVLLSLTPAGERLLAHAHAARATTLQHLLAPVGALRSAAIAQAVHDLADLLASGVLAPEDGPR